MDVLVGIIGGLGPKAGAQFIQSLIDRTDAERDQGHVNFLMINHAAIPDRSAYILDRTKPNPLPYLIEDVRMLSRANVSFIVIPCNTAHYFYDELQAATETPVINMIRETVLHIRRQFPDARKAGILATEGTIAGKMYQKELERAGLVPVVPPDQIQTAVNCLIFDQVKQGKAINYHLYYRVLDSMHQMGCDTVILGCTELSVVEKGAAGHAYRVVDSQEVLVERTILAAGKNVKECRQDKPQTDWRNIV